MISTHTETKNNVSIADAAKAMDKSQQYIRIGLQRGILTFGTAQIMPREDKI